MCNHGAWIVTEALFQTREIYYHSGGHVTDINRFVPDVNDDAT